MLRIIAVRICQQLSAARREIPSERRENILKKRTFGSKISEVITKAEEIAPIDPAPLNIRPKIQLINNVYFNPFRVK